MKDVMEVRAIPHLRQVVEPIEVTLMCRSKIKKWAYDNAYTLVFLSVMFVITWIVLAVVSYV